MGTGSRFSRVRPLPESPNRFAPGVPELALSAVEGSRRLCETWVLRPERDIQFTLGPIDSLDHASRLANKMGIDATRKWPTEGFTRPWPDEIVMDTKTKALVDGKWKALAKELGID